MTNSIDYIQLFLQSPLWPSFITQPSFRFTLTLLAVFMVMTVVAPVLCAVFAWQSRPRGKVTNPGVSIGFMVAAVIFVACGIMLWLGGWTRLWLFIPYALLGPALLVVGLVWGGRPGFKPSRLTLIIASIVLIYLVTLPLIVIKLYPPTIHLSS